MENFSLNINPECSRRKNNARYIGRDINADAVPSDKTPELCLEFKKRDTDLRTSILADVILTISTILHCRSNCGKWLLEKHRFFVF